MAHNYEHSHPEDDLVNRLRKHEKEAVTQLYRMYSAALYGIILRIVKEKLAAEEILQDCFIKAWTSFPQYDSGKGRLFTWLLAIARHMAIDKIRSSPHRNGQKTQTLNLVHESTLESTVSFRPEHIGVRELVDTLSGEYREVVDLLYFGGYTHVEAAEALNIPLGTLKTKVRQALIILRQSVVE